MPATSRTRRLLRRLYLLAALLMVIPISTAAVALAAPRSYYVAPSGTDANDGLSLTSPFKTIQRCASVASSGDTCLIRSGVYRETVTPATSGITFAPYDNEHVTVSGLDVSSGWTRARGAIYQAAMPWSMNIRARGNGNDQISSDQVFVDGQMMVEARWPNIDPARITRATRYDAAQADTATITSANQATYNDAHLAVFPANYWVGGKISFGPGYNIVWTTCDVTGSTAGSVSFTCNEDPGTWGKQPGGGARSSWNTDLSVTDFVRPSAKNFYTLWGKPEGLDAPGEWFRTGTASAGTLSLWLPGSDDPAQHTIEVKRRAWAFDLSGQANSTIRGLTIVGAGIKTNAASTGTLIDGITGRYLWHFQQIPAFYERNGTEAIQLFGSNSTLRDSYLSASAGPMVALAKDLPTTNNQILNTVIEDAGYGGNVAAIVGSSPGGAQRHTLTQSTIFNTGRFAIQAEQGLDITYTDVYNTHLLISDLGSIYGSSTDGRGAVIAYNLVHDNWALRDDALSYYGGFGIYLDDNTYNYTVHHNVVWNTTSPGIFTMGANGTTMPNPKPAPTAPSNRRIYNNTVDGTIGAHAKPSYYGLPQVNTGTEFRNNLATKLELDEPGLTLGTNSQTGGLFVDQANHTYLLRSYAPAVNAGEVLPPYTDGYGGAAPDLGAYELGQTPFVAGAVLRQQDLSGLKLRCDTQQATASCIVDGLPRGRKLPATFQVQIGTSSAGGCTTTMDYAAHVGVGYCKDLPLNGQQGPQPIRVQLGSGIPVDTGTVLDLSATSLAVTEIAPASGSTHGGTVIAISGRQFPANAGSYTRSVQISNPQAQALYDYQVPVEIDTQALISAGKLRADCGDLRFSETYGALPYWIEAGCNTTATRIWIRIPYMPPGQSSITLTYGNRSLFPGSNGHATFSFYEDFADGVPSSLLTLDTAAPGITVAETGGHLRVSGATTNANQADLFGFQIHLWDLKLPTDFAIDSALSVTAGSDQFKAMFGSDALGLYGRGNGTPSGKPIGYYAAGWQLRGHSSLTSATVSQFRVSLGQVGPLNSRTLYWMENGDLLNPRTVRSGVDSPSMGSFRYGPDAVANFDVAFDAIRVRHFTFPEPTASLDVIEHSASGLSATVGGQLCINIQVTDSQSLTCSTPQGHGVADVVLTLTNGQSATLSQAFTYVQVVYLPLLMR